MVEISLEESVALYDECERFSDGGMVSEESPLRKKAKEIFHQSYVSHMMTVCSMVYRTLAQSYTQEAKQTEQLRKELAARPPVQRLFGIQRAFQGDVLARLRETQCCDPVIDSLLGAAIEEIARLRSSVRNQAGDNLCWMNDADVGKIPPKHEFMQSCERYHAQVSGERGGLVGCMTIAQLEAENQRLRDELAKCRNTPSTL